MDDNVRHCWLVCCLPPALRRRRFKGQFLLFSVNRIQCILGCWNKDFSNIYLKMDLNSKTLCKVKKLVPHHQQSTHIDSYIYFVIFSHFRTNWASNLMFWNITIWQSVDHWASQWSSYNSIFLWRLFILWQPCPAKKRHKWYDITNYIDKCQSVTCLNALNHVLLLIKVQWSL